MLTQRIEPGIRFTRRDAGRLGTAAAVLALVLTLILGIDILVPQALSLEAGDVVRADITAPRAASFDSEVQTEARRQEARAAVPPQYDFSAQNGEAVAAEQLGALRRAVLRELLDHGLQEREAVLELAGTVGAGRHRPVLAVAFPGGAPEGEAEPDDGGAGQEDLEHDAHAGAHALKNSARNPPPVEGLQAKQEGDEVLLLLARQVELQDQVEELDGVVECGAAPVVEVRRRVLDAA